MTRVLGSVVFFAFKARKIKKKVTAINNVSHVFFSFFFFNIRSFDDSDSPNNLIYACHTSSVEAYLAAFQCV